MLARLRDTETFEVARWLGEGHNFNYLKEFLHNTGVECHMRDGKLMLVASDWDTYIQLGDYITIPGLDGDDVGVFREATFHQRFEFV